MIEQFLKGLPGWIDELNELTIVGLIGLIVVWLIIRELGRFGYKRKLQKIVKKVTNGNGDTEETLSGKKLPNPHASSDQLLDFLVEEVNAIKKTQGKIYGELKEKIGRVEGKVDVLLSRAE